ncbi:MAG: hypothetical protein ACXWDO_08005 [Bacteroidia bacterium]
MITRKLYATNKTGKTNPAGGKIIKLPLLHSAPKVFYKGKPATTFAENGKPLTTKK